MRFVAEQLALPGVCAIAPNVASDLRGFSSTTYSAEEFKALGITSEFVEGYTSYSHKDVVRGLHFQRAPYAQDKLVRCAQGEIMSVVADVDPTSSSYGQHVSLRMDSAKQNMLFVPGKYAYGFCVVSDGALVEYRLSNTYQPQTADGVRYDDPRLAIEWPTTKPILSEKDTQWPPLS